jgi:hypothetical protein
MALTGASVYSAYAYTKGERAMRTVALYACDLAELFCESQRRGSTKHVGLVVNCSTCYFSEVLQFRDETHSRRTGVDGQRHRVVGTPHPFRTRRRAILG